MNHYSTKSFLTVQQDETFSHAAFLTMKCECGKEVTINAHWSELDKWGGGESIEKVFPLLPPEVREMMISGVCGKCWKEACVK